MKRDVLKLLITCGVVLFSPMVVIAQNTTELPSIDEVVEVKTTDAKVELAKAEARKSLPKILEQLDAMPPSWSDVSFKVAFPVTEDQSEFMWVIFADRSGSAFRGVLGNEPRRVDYVKYGDPVTFTEDQIADWQYVKNGKLHGHYTTRALLDEASPETRAQMLAILSETPE